MKRTSCGRQGVVLAIAALAVAVAPAVARADLGASVPAVAAPAPAVSAPAVPAVSAPAVSAPTPVPAPTPAPVSTSTPVADVSVDPTQPAASVATPVVDVTKTPTSLVVKGGSKDVTATSDAKQVVQEVATTAVARASRVHSRVAKTVATKTGDPTITKTVSVTVDPRHPLNTGTNPLFGCTAGFQACTTIPDFPFTTNNQCNNEQVALVGRYTLWMQLSTNPLSGTVTMHQRSFFVGFNGQGDQGNIYAGTDSQNDFQRTFALGPVSIDHSDYQTLIVTDRNHAPAPNMFMYFRTVTYVDPTNLGNPQIAVYGPFIVCQSGQKHHDDNQNCNSQYRDDDNYGDKHHHTESYKGYNNDSNTWDD